MAGFVENGRIIGYSNKFGTGHFQNAAAAKVLNEYIALAVGTTTGGYLTKGRVLDKNILEKAIGLANDPGIRAPKKSIVA